MTSFLAVNPVYFHRQFEYTGSWGDRSLKKGFRFYEKLFFSTFCLSAFTFGGGYVIVPLMRKRFVEQYHWIEEQEMLDLIAIAQSSPGAMAVNASILVGYRLAGLVGALITVAGTVLPPLIIISVISLAYQAFRDNAVISLLLKGMQAGVAAVIANVVCSMAAGIMKQKRVLPVVVMVGTFVASAFLHINVAFCVLACAAVGLLDAACRRRRGKEANEK